MARKSDWGVVARDSAHLAHKAEIESYKAQVEAYKATVRDLEAQLGVVEALETAPSGGAAMTLEASSSSKAVAFALASDWHVEETVESKSVNGLNKFDLEVADRRVRTFFSSVVRLTEIERNGTEIDTCVLWLGGDLMSGYIHEELQETNSLSPTETLLWLRERLAGGIALLAGNFSKVIVATSYGNHGRTTKKPRHATGYRNSYEWLLYRMMSQEPRDKVSWLVADSYFNYLDIYGKTIRLHHGDSLSYQGGIGGLTIPVEKAIASWNKGRVADLDVFGHWHQQQQNPKWVSNGSLIGYNAYALSIKAAYEPAQQTFFLLDHERGRTVTAPIVLQ
jgi:uncharacterized protein YaiE (UPF0345 family)